MYAAGHSGWIVLCLRRPSELSCFRRMAPEPNLPPTPNSHPSMMRHESCLPPRSQQSRAKACIAPLESSRRLSSSVVRFSVLHAVSSFPPKHGRLRVVARLLAQLVHAKITLVPGEAETSSCARTILRRYRLKVRT